MQSLKKSAKHQPEKNAERLHWVDFIRGLAVILMFITHSARLKLEYTGGNKVIGFFDSAIWFFITIEPYTFAAFLFIAGFSLTYHYLTREPDSSSFLKDTFKRFLQLSLISIILFVMDKGFQWPEMFTTSGALFSIAASLLTISFFLTLNKSPSFFLLIAFPLSSILFSYYLFSRKLYIPGVNVGPASFVCENAFAFFGAWFAHLYIASKSRALNQLFALGVIFFIAGISLSSQWTLEAPIRYLVYNKDPSILSFVKGFFSGAKPQLTEYSNWHYLPSGLLMMLLPLSITTFITVKIKNKIYMSGILAPFMTLGRHSLFAYVFHLTVLSMIYVFQIKITNPVMIWGLVTTLIFITMKLLQLGFGVRFK